MGIEPLIIALLILMLVAALVAVESRDLLSSVIAVGAAGFGLSVIDLLVGAPDLAITQVVVEVIALVLLIRVVITRKDTSEAAPPDSLRTAVAVLAGGIILVVAFFAVGGSGSTRAQAGTMPPFGEPKMAAGATGPDAPVGARYLANAAEETGSVNAVTAVLLDYRAYDTLGEATVIFASILGAFAILRRVGRRKEGSSG